MALALPLGSLPALPTLPGVPSLGGTPDPSASGNANAGGANGLTAAFNTGTLGLDSLTGLAGGLGGLGGIGGAAEGGNGTVFNSAGGALGPFFMQAEQATYGVPVLGDLVSGALGTSVEGGGVQNILLSQAFGTPLFGPLQSLVGGNSQGDEIILYELATRPVALTEGLPVVNELTREIVTGSFANPGSAFIGPNLGGLVSEDFQQNFVSSNGTLGTVVNQVENVLLNSPGGNFIFDGDDLNSVLDQVTNLTDQVPNGDDYVAGALGGDALSNTLPFDHAFGGLLGSVNTAGVLAPVGDQFYTGITPLATAIQEVAIAGPISLGSLGKLI